MTFMTWNLMHPARVIKDAGRIPAYGNPLLESGWSPLEGENS
jgi:hypothetical protein